MCVRSGTRVCSIALGWIRGAPRQTSAVQSSTLPRCGVTWTSPPCGDSSPEAADHITTTTAAAATARAASASEEEEEDEEEEEEEEQQEEQQEEQEE